MVIKMRFKGWKHIFSFTYLQQVKSKGFIASTVIICVLIIAIAALIGVLSFSGIEDVFGEENSETKGLDTLYICNETQIPDFDASISDIHCVSIDKSKLEGIQETVKTGDKAEAVLHVIYENGEKGGNVRLKFYRPMNKEAVSDNDMDYVASECRYLFKASLLTSLGVDMEDVGLAETVFSSEISVYGEEMSEFREMLNIVAPMLFAAIMFMFIISYAQIIAQSVAMEKTSRVIELLITSVRPLAIVMGKVFAMLLVVLTQIVIIGAVVGASVGILSLIAVSAGGGELINAAQGAGEAIQAADISWQSELSKAVPGLFEPISIIAIIVIFLLGFLFYSLLAALIGAGISRSEDLAAGMQPLALISLLGFFLSYLPAAFNMGYSAGSGDLAAEPNVIMIAARYLPISSPFALPSAIVLGQMGAAEIIISTLILALLTLGTMLLVAKVYENIILYSGSALKLGQIIKMAKSK